MYEILVVDDEAVERQVVRFLLEKYGFPVTVTEATNGNEALELLREKRFRILFTDIRMPFVDGLELAGQARLLDPELHIVFFSGFDDFEYARQALSLRVIDYILKPVDPEEFQKTIAGAIEQLRRQDQAAKEKTEAQRVVRRHVLRQLLSGIAPAQLTALYPQWDCSFLREYHRLLLLKLSRTPNSEGAVFPGELAEPQLPDHCHCVNLKPGLSLILFSGQRHQEKWYRELSARISKHLRKSHAVDCFIQIGKEFQAPEEIYPAYLEAEQALQESAFFPPDNAPDSEIAGSVCNESMVNTLSTDIHMLDGAGLRRHMCVFLEELQRQQPQSHVYIRYLCTNIAKVLLDTLADRTDKAFDAYARSIWADSFAEIQQRLLELTEKVASQLEQESPTQNHGISMVKQYIRKHYGESLSLDILADVVHLSPRYLSSLFMEEEGIGINRYIKAIRMAKAQELLTETNLKVTEVCEKVGYTNLSYFCKSFSEYYGVTPDKFRTLSAGEKGAPHD